MTVLLNQPSVVIPSAFVYDTKTNSLTTLLIEPNWPFTKYAFLRFSILGSE